MACWDNLCARSYTIMGGTLCILLWYGLANDDDDVEDDDEDGEEEEDNDSAYLAYSHVTILHELASQLQNVITVLQNVIRYFRKTLNRIV